MDVAGTLTAARRRREAETRLMREGLDVWRCRQQQLLAKKAQEQKQLREMLMAYSPWGRPGGGAPNSDTIRKRKALQLGTLYGAPPSTSPGTSLGDAILSPSALGSLGAGVSSGNNLPAGNLHGSGCQTLPCLPSQSRHTAAPRRLRCDPQLLFQFQEADRRAVDNMLRYRTDPRQQEQYRRDLDRMVQEKRLRQQQQQLKQKQQHNRQQQLQHHHNNHHHDHHEQDDHEEQGDTCDHPENHVRRRRSAEQPPQPQRDRNSAGVELVPLLDRRRNEDPLSPAPRVRGHNRPGAHLPTTDVTNVTKVKEDVSQEREQTWRELAEQIDRKKRQTEATRAEEVERSRQHFETWQMLWGRPGHGAPRDVKVKENLDVILYHHLDRNNNNNNKQAATTPTPQPQPLAAR